VRPVSHSAKLDFAGTRSQTRVAEAAMRVRTRPGINREVGNAP